MRPLVFAVLLALALPCGPALAASYLQTDGAIVDPILYRCCIAPNGDPPEPHPYSGIDLEPGADLQGVDLNSADLRDAALSNADLRGAFLGSTDLGDADLANTDLRGADLIVTRLRNADLSGANLSGTTGFGADMSSANLTSAVWVDSVVDEVSLIEANLSFADLRGWHAEEVYGSGASFVEANLDGSRLSVLVQNANFTDASLRGASFVFIDDTPTDLSGANLAGADLTGASFSSTQLGQGGNPDYGKISLLGADFSKAVLLDVVGLGNTVGAARYDAETDFTNAWADLDATIPFDPVVAGWTFIPEPGGVLLIGLGLFGLARRRRARNA